jgi:hypothetical protein
MLTINRDIVDTIQDLLQKGATASAGTEQKYRKLCIIRWIVVFPGFFFWLLLNLGHFSVFPFTSSNELTRSQKLAFSSKPVFNRQGITHRENVVYYASVAG